MGAKNWKLVECFEDNRVERHSLKDDLGEKADRAQQMPDKATALRKQLHAWRVPVDAAMSSPNPA